MNGFKSCMDRTVLDFRAGVTGIVGPNGCGKSNIVDAIRWVLGEQSAKHLRGQAMEDVIFAGNTEHGPLGAAQVTLTFDNEDKFHLEGEEEGLVSEALATLKDVPEIEVTRRLYRSGESEYLLNARPCRLRDITELFLGTGVGRRAYSIIEQGRVGRIVESKPEDLRLLIEEAAGTTLYRSRKQAAERRIERTKENLARVNDILVELERQMRSLRRQARGALKFKELKQAEEDLDRRLTARKLRGVSSRLETIRERLAEISGEERRAREGLADLNQQRQAARERRDALEKRAEEARAAVYDAKARLDRLEDERRFLSNRIDELRRLLREGHEEIKALETKLTACVEEEKSLITEREQLDASLDGVGCDLEERQSAITKIETKMKEAGQELEALKGRLIDCLAAEAAANNEKAALRRQLDASGERQRRYTQESSSLDIVAEGLVEEVTACQNRLDGLSEKLRHAERGKEVVANRLKEVLERKSRVSRESEDAREEVAALESRYQSLREMNESFVGYTDGVRAFMSNGGVEHTGARAVVADIMEIEEGYEKAVAAVFQEALQYVVVPDTDAGLRGADYLRDRECGRASFIPMRPREVDGPDNVPPGFSRLTDHLAVREGYDQVVKTLVRDVVVADSLGEATGQWRMNGYHATFVTLDGETVNRQGVVTGGSGSAGDEGLLQRNAELRSTKRALDVAVGIRDSSVAVLAEVREEARRVGEELSGLDRQLHELAVAKVGCEGDLEVRRQNLVRTRDRARTLAEEQQTLAAEMAVLKETVDSSAGAVAAIEEEKGRLEGLRRRVEADLAALEQERRGIADRLEGLRVEAAEIRLKKDNCDLRRKSLAAAREDLRGRLMRLGERMGRDSRELDIATLRLREPELDVDKARESMRASKAEFEQADSEYKAQQGVFDAQDKLIGEQGEALDKVREQRGGYELDGRQCELEYVSIEDGLRERLGIDAATLIDQQPEEELDVDEIRGDLDTVRDRIRRLGTVNIGAVNELEEIENRYNELASQRDDL
ncbi:MAG: chromosome segregation protein SMC, partial [Candidatus Binatia bacterium]